MNDRQPAFLFRKSLHVSNVRRLAFVFVSVLGLLITACGNREEGRTSGIIGFKGERPPTISEEKWRTVPTTPGHKDHVSTASLRCSDCHNEPDYASIPEPSVCLSCHTEDKFQGEPLAKNHCLACHVFRVQKTGFELIPEEGDCQTCHSEEVQAAVNNQFFDESAAMAISCKSCHKPHDSDYQIESASCLSCHDVYKSSSLENPGHASCIQCHTPHSWRNDATIDFCTRCHSQLTSVMEHNFPFHPKECKSCHSPHLKPTYTSGQCMNCHDDDKWQYALPGIPEKHKECTICHNDTDWGFLGVGRCASCHAQKIYGKGNAPPGVPSAHKRCISCHKQHSWYAPEGSSSCSKCHSAIVKQTSIHRKKGCTICHSIHAPGFKGFSTCAACHHNPAKNSKNIAVKENCALCHSPHTWRIKFPQNTTEDLAKVLAIPIVELKEKQDKGEKIDLTDEQKTALHTVSASKYCGECHDEVRTAGLTTKNELKADCALCHADHKWRPDDDLCASCHGDILNETTVEAKQSCSLCHANHKWRPEMPGDCAMCHPAQVESGDATKEKVKANCALCHQPHTWEFNIECSMCHSDVADELADSSHVSCDFCHADHNWKPAYDSTCANCHSDVVDEASKTKMTDCTMCHAAHTFTKDESQMTPCFACHSDAKPADESSIKNNCSMCHSPHSWKADEASCTMCHTDMAEKGLHKVETHQSCSICHGEHKWRNVSSETCAMCHGDKTEGHHEERTCLECHWFKK